MSQTRSNDELLRVISEQEETIEAQSEVISGQASEIRRLVELVALLENDRSEIY